MIYTVTFNPSLDYIVSVPDFQTGLTNRTESELLLPGGKGINVSTVLRNLGIENTALGFVAGFTGDEVVRRLESLGVRNGFIRIEEGFTRINLKLKSIDGTEINGQGPEIGTDKAELLMRQLETLGSGDVLFLSGSIPASMRMIRIGALWRDWTGVEYRSQWMRRSRCFLTYWNTIRF